MKCMNESWGNSWVIWPERYQWVSKGQQSKQCSGLTRNCGRALPMKFVQSWGLTVMANCQLTKRWISFTCLPPCFFTSSPCLQLLLRDHQKGRFKRLKLSRKNLSRRARAVGLLARATRMHLLAVQHHWQGASSLGEDMDHLRCAVFFFQWVWRTSPERIERGCGLQTGCTSLHGDISNFWIAKVLDGLWRTPHQAWCGWQSLLLNWCEFWKGNFMESFFIHVCLERRSKSRRPCGQT